MSNTMLYPTIKNSRHYVLALIGLLMLTVTIINFSNMRKLLFLPLALVACLFTSCAACLATGRNITASVTQRDSVSTTIYLNPSSNAFPE